MPNDIRLLRAVVSDLATHGLPPRVMGGWADELHGVTPPRPHRDIDLLLVDPDLVALQVWVARHTEIAGKRVLHKRAALVDGVLVELFIAHSRGPDVILDFWGRYRWTLPNPAIVVVDGLDLVSTATLAAYRADWELIRSAAPQGSATRQQPG